MHQVVALVAFISLSILSQSNLSWSLAISNGVNEQDVENLFQNDVQQTANNNVNTITNEKTLVEQESEYSCFPWIFNPGIFMLAFEITVLISYKERSIVKLFGLIIVFHTFEDAL